MAWWHDVDDHETIEEFNRKVALLKKMLEARRPWEHVRAWIPTNVNGQWIWLRKYYKRDWLVMPQSNVPDRALDELDILKRFGS